MEEEEEEEGCESNLNKNTNQITLLWKHSSRRSWYMCATVYKGFKV